MLEYVDYNERNEKILTQIGGINSDMLMDITVKKLLKGQKAVVQEEQKEAAILLLSGALSIQFAGKTEEMHRKNPFDERPYCLHCAKQTVVEIEAIEDSEFILQKTDNDKIFEPVFYTPADCRYEEAGQDQWEGAAHREIVTVFDLDNAPYSNMVLGEVINKPGRWSSYPPHHHPQPEVYYYLFDRPQGFGACFVGDEVFKIEDGSVALISGGNCHQQVTAPSYKMYYCWMIRHLPNDLWDKTRIYDEAHTWMLSE